MGDLAHSFNGWTTDQLLEEAMRRAAADGPALRRLGRTVLRARLAEADDRSRGIAPAAGRALTAGIVRTVELSLAD
jgi:hypothetical protein